MTQVRTLVLASLALVAAASVTACNKNTAANTSDNSTNAAMAPASNDTSNAMMGGNAMSGGNAASNSAATNAPAG